MLIFYGNISNKFESFCIYVADLVVLALSLRVRRSMLKQSDRFKKYVLLNLLFRPELLQEKNFNNFETNYHVGQNPIVE